MTDISAARRLSKLRKLTGRGVATAALLVLGSGCAAEDTQGAEPTLAAGTGSGGAGSNPPGAGGSATTLGRAGAAGALSMAGTSSTAPPSEPEDQPPISARPSTEVCPTLQATRTPLRRLTRYEYANTVKHLLNVEVAAINDIPVDEVTDGFSNNAAVLTISSLHAEKYVLAAEALAKEAVKNLPQLSPCDTAAQGEEACAVEFARRFGRRAFRRPTGPEDERLLMAAYAAGRTGGSHAEGIEVMIRAILQSPHFLYRLETTAPNDAAAKLVPLSQYELGTRLSYLIWSSGPDDALLDAAARGELGSKAQVAEKARAMLQDPRARRAIAEFYDQWVGTTRLDVTSKNTALFPSYSSSVRDAMARELPAFVEYVLWSGDGKLNTLLTAPVAFVSGPLAQLYGVTAPAASGTAPQMVMLPTNQGRAGILTQAGVMAVQAHPDQTSPVLRGKFIRTKLLCQPPPPPPPDADISPPEIDQGGTARERFSKHLEAGTSCNGCHLLMDPLGLAFENFDALGRYRETDAGRPIDVSGEVLAATDPSLAGSFVGARELAEKLAASDQVRDCVATQWFRFASGRSEEGSDACSLATLQESFAASDGDLTELVVAMTQTDAFWYRTPVTP